MSVGALKRFTDRPPPPVGERCEMCTEPIADEHSHVVNVETRHLFCTCRACWLLFTHKGAAGGKMRAVPERVRFLPGFALDERGWDALQVPVRTAFFFRSSSAQGWVAVYPSPAGATESQLGLEAWEEIAAQNPVIAELEPDVEALLVHAPRGASFTCFVVPINSCYELVGRVRRGWRGFDGGEDVWRDIDAFFQSLRERSEVA